jgi:hypothetical protein
MDEAWSSDEPEDEDEDRWLFVQPIGSRPAYRDMLAFIATRETTSWPLGSHRQSMAAAPSAGSKTP